MELSYSQISDWLQCRYKWFLGYDYKGQGLAEVAPSKPLLRGSAVHEGLAALMQAQFGYADGTFQQPPGYPDALDGIVAAVEDGRLDIDAAEAEECMAIAWAAFQNIDWEKYKVAQQTNGDPAVEVKVEYPLPGGHTFRGFVDLLLEDRATGKVWVVDYKVRKRFVWAKDMETDMQLAVYAYMLKQMGYDIGGVAYYEIRSDLLDAFVQNPQGAWVPSGRGKSAPFKFTRLYKSDDELRNIWTGVVWPAADDIASYHTAAEFKAVNKADLVSPNPGYVPRVVQPNICGRCQFQELCFEGLRGGDPEFIAEENFKPKEPKG